MFAQGSWKVGDEITEEIGWGNLSFENDPMDYWKFESSKGSTTQTGGLFEVYDGADADLYQYVQLPAGMYKVECQAYYRCGNSWAEDPNLFGTEDWEDNALLYVQNGKYDIESETFTKNITFKTPLMPRLFLNQQEQLYVGLKEGEEGYPGWDMSDGSYGDKGWGPCSVPGSLVWFQAGLYAPYVDEDNPRVKYNTVTFYLLEDGYVRVGVSKKEPKSADSFMCTNFKMYYMGEAGEAAELMALQDEVAEIYETLEALQDKAFEDELYLFGGLIGDVLGEFEGEYGSIEGLTKEQCGPAKDMLAAALEEANAAAAIVSNLNSLIKSAQILYNATNYAGKADFGAAIDAAKVCVDPNYEPTGKESFSIFQENYDALTKARLDYLMSQEPVNGAYDFSSAINFPFFCDNEYTPQWNADANAYQFPTIEGVEDGLQLENTWATIQEQGYKDAKAEAGRESWIPICDNVQIYEKVIEGQWYIKSTTWHGGSLGVTMQHSYPAIGGWTASPTGNAEILSQTITGLPNGYYAMSALMCNAGADISDLQYVFIQNGDMIEKSPLTQKGNPWWGGNKEAWRSGVWEKLTTSMIQVTDGTVTIGSSSDAFYAATGFQLYYYGETPNFGLMLAERIAAANQLVEGLAWKGDKAAAAAILAQMPAEINSNETYLEAQNILAAVENYASVATAAYAQMDKTVTAFSDLAAAQPEGSAEGDFIATAWLTAMGVEDEEEAVYTWAAEYQKDYEAYVAYLDYRASMGDLAETNDELAAAIAEQNNYLTENYANAAKLAELTEALAAPYNKAALSDLIANASESNPVDITLLINNPKFDEGQKGWSGTAMTLTGPSIAEDLGAAEIWNTNFDVYQTIYSLPAGWYGIDAQACYRDAGDAKGAYTNWWYGEAAGEMEFWPNTNAKLYANDNETSIVSIASEMFAEPSMTEFRDKMIADEEGDEQGNDVMVPHWKVLDTDKVHFDEETGKFVNDYYHEYEDGTQWYWDSKVEDLDEVYYYPASLTGMSKRFEKSPEAYHNQVFASVEEGGSLRFGIRKNVLIGNDWVVFDNFKLYYYGQVKPAVAIGEITTAGSNGAEAIFGINGVRQSNLVKGLNIVKKADGTVRKVFVK